MSSVRRDVALIHTVPEFLFARQGAGQPHSRHNGLGKVRKSVGRYPASSSLVKGRVPPRSRHYGLGKVRRNAGPYLALSLLARGGRRPIQAQWARGGEKKCWSYLASSSLVKGRTSPIPGTTLLGKVR
jgi:hypothetical protein